VTAICLLAGSSYCPLLAAYSFCSAPRFSGSFLCPGSRFARVLLLFPPACPPALCRVGAGRWAVQIPLPPCPASPVCTPSALLAATVALWPISRPLLPLAVMRPLLIMQPRPSLPPAQPDKGRGIGPHSGFSRSRNSSRLAPLSTKLSTAGPVSPKSSPLGWVLTPFR